MRFTARSPFGSAQRKPLDSASEVWGPMVDGLSPPPLELPLLHTATDMMATAAVTPAAHRTDR